MKPNYTTIISAFVFLLFLQVPHYTKAASSDFIPLSKLREKCENAVSMDCKSKDYLTSHFVNEGEEAVLTQESCIEASGQGVLTEQWLSVDLFGSNVYYLDGYGVNAGIEVYKGSCDELGMIDCVNAQGDDTFIEIWASESVHYYIRLLGYDLSGRDEFEVVLNCGIPEPACELSIDNVEVGSCVSNLGTVSLFMSGTVGPEPDVPVIFAEVTTDVGFYVYTGESVNGLWEASFEVSGTVINFVSVFSGNTGSGCGDALSGGDLPTVPCARLVPVFTGSIDWNENCGKSSGEVRLYEPGTDILLETYSVIVLNNGLFEIENAPSGIYDMILKVNGFLPKGFSSVEISLTENTYGCGLLKHGDLNGDGVIDMLDVTILIDWFGSVLPSDNSLNYLDQNCDGIINIIDVTSIIAMFDTIGDTVPLD